MKGGATILTLRCNAKRRLVLLTIPLLALCLSSNTVHKNTSNYKMHCLYIYKFSHLVSWPKSKPEFTIGVIGISPLIPELQGYINSKNRTSAIKYKLVRFANTQSISDCNILYVCKDQLSSFESIVLKTEGKQTLLISEVGGLIRKGSCINLITEEGASIKIQINKSAIESRKLNYSSELIKLANEVI